MSAVGGSRLCRVSLSLKAAHEHGACVLYGHCGALEQLGERVPALCTKAVGSIDHSSEVEIRA